MTVIGEKTLWNEIEIKSELSILLKIMILKLIQHHLVVCE